MQTAKKLDALITYLKEQAPTWDVECFCELDSTNRYAKALAADRQDVRALITAEAQTAGRGRMGRSFYSPRGTGLYFSLVFPAGDLSKSLTLTCAASVAVMRAVKELTGKQLGIKWVNDLFYRDRKVAGILAEGVTVGGRTAMVIGIGINVGEATFPSELAQIAGCLGEKALSHEALLISVCKHLLPYIKDSSRRDWIGDYRRHSTVLNRSVQWIQGGVTREGRAMDIDENGILTVIDGDDREHRLSTGEITLRPL